MKSQFRFILAAIIFTTVSAIVTHAAILVDTGAGGTSPGLSLFNTVSTDGYFQNLAGEFTISDPFSITSVEAWMGGSSGLLNVVLRNNSGGLPGTSVFSQSFLTSGSWIAHWAPFSGLNWQLPGGTYWIALEPAKDSSLQGGLPTGAPNPLLGYAYCSDGHNGYRSLSRQNSLGFRIVGIPEPSSNSLMALGLTALTLLHRRKIA